MEIKVNVPDKLSEITLGQYQKYWRVLEDNKEDLESDNFIRLKMLEIFCGLKYKDIKAFRLADINRITNGLHNLLGDKPELVQSFKIGDKEFGFIPKLEDISFGEYVDLDLFLPDWSQMHKAMAVLYRPVKQKIDDSYLIEDYEPELYWDVMKYTPLDAVISSIVFFYHLGKDLSSSMIHYLSDPENKDNIPETQTSAQNGVGTRASLRYLKAILDDMKI